VGLARALEERHRDDDAELARERRETRDGVVPLDGLREREETLVLGLAEVGPLEELRREDHVRARRRRGAHVLLDTRDVGGDVVTEWALEHGDRDRLVHVGSCCVMQWKDPPPRRIARDERPMVCRSGNKSASVARASSSSGTPYVGTITARFAM
jgi:hypothetical protein